MAHYKLAPADEYPHDPGAEALFNESVYVNGFDHERAYGGWMRLGNRANEGYAELAVCLFLPDGRIACQFQRPAIDANREFSAGGLSYEVIRPHEEVVMRYAGEVMLVADRGLFREPRRLFGEAERATCELEWRVRGVSPIHGGLPVGEGQQTMFGRDFSLGHFNQHTAVAARLRIGGADLDFDGWGWRDHSWGPRLWQNILFDRGFYAAFGPERGITLLKIANRDGAIRRAGVLFRDGRYEDILDLDVFTDWDAARDPVAVTLTARTASWRAVIHGRVLNVAPLSNRRRIDGAELHSRIAECITEFEWDGYRGYGMTEYVERLEHGVPVAWPL
ncbi:MAG: hypothetical protein KDK06_10615 [Gammaproteobacteria bacterium]|nr:hypothetical protein [Gammaproteobacteria bacterium]